MSATSTAGAVQPADGFGARFIAEALRLGVPLSSSEIEQLRGATEAQVMSAVERHAPSLNRELFQLLSTRGPESLARELSLSWRRKPGANYFEREVADMPGIVGLIGKVVQLLAAKGGK